MDRPAKQAEEAVLTDMGDATAAIVTLARVHGVTAEAQPIDSFAEAASRLSNAETSPDRIERLLIGLQRAGAIGDDERFALHTTYLRQQAHQTATAMAKDAREATPRREDCVRAGIASVVIEGGEVDEEAQALLAQWAREEISAEDLMATILKPYAAGR